MSSRNNRGILLRKICEMSRWKIRRIPLRDTQEILFREFQENSLNFKPAQYEECRFGRFKKCKSAIFEDSCSEWFEEFHFEILLSYLGKNIPRSSRNSIWKFPWVLKDYNPKVWGFSYQNILGNSFRKIWRKNNVLKDLKYLVAKDSNNSASRILWILFRDSTDHICHS